MTAWAEFIKSSDVEMRRNEMNRGMSYEPTPGVLTIDAVSEYVDGFAWCGVGAREVIQAVGRDERGVKRALATLVEDGKLLVKETATRGPKASKRKVYYPVENQGPVLVEFGPMQDELLAARANEYGCGGGKKTPIRSSMTH